MKALKLEYKTKQGLLLQESQQVQPCPRSIAAFSSSAVGVALPSLQPEHSIRCSVREVNYAILLNQQQYENICKHQYEIHSKGIFIHNFCNCRAMNHSLLSMHNPDCNNLTILEAYICCHTK